MAQLFIDEKKYPDNTRKKNFVFLGYPFTPPLPADDYRNVVKELEAELPIRLWYFLDEVTTAELMRKIWRAILRADLSIFDVSNGNPNVAFEMGLAVANENRCFALLKTGEGNPLGGADLGYAEWGEYTSAATLKAKLRELLINRSAALKDLYDLSFDLHHASMGFDREDLEKRIQKVVMRVFQTKKITKRPTKTILGSDKAATLVLNGLRRKGILRVEGQKRGSKWVFTDAWVHQDHEVAGL